MTKLGEGGWGERLLLQLIKKNKEKCHCPSSPTHCMKSGVLGIFISSCQVKIRKMDRGFFESFLSEGLPFFAGSPAVEAFRAISLRSPKSGVPKPVTGSQPLVAWNPCVPHPGLFPLTMSFRPLYPWAYNHGLRNPRDGSPAAIRASFKSETTPAKA